MLFFVINIKYCIMAAAITTAAIGVGLSGFQAYQGKEQQRKAKNALQNYDRQNLEDSNAYKSIPISTVGSDIMREDNQLASANAIDAARNMGTRGAAMLPGIVAANNRSNNETRAYLDDQINRRNYAIAGDEQNIRSLQEERENADLAGIGNQMQVGQQNMWSGFRGMANSAMYGLNNTTRESNPQLESVNSLKPMGLNAKGNSGSLITTPGFDMNKFYRNYNL